MLSISDGSTELTCHALLEHPWRARHSQIAVIFDAILKGSRIADGNPLMCCSFHYIEKGVGERLNTGIYDVVVRVSNLYRSCLACAHCNWERPLVFKLVCMNPA